MKGWCQRQLCQNETADLGCSAAYGGTALAFRDRLIIDWNKTQQSHTFADQKRVYYLSLEFLMGRALDNAMLNVGLKDVARGALIAVQATALSC